LKTAALNADDLQLNEVICPSKIDISYNLNNLLFRYQNLTGNLILARGHKSDCGVGGRIDGEVTFPVRFMIFIVMI
jgi:hypothetical protein